jgi:GGDEF domain-containing protein
MAFKLPDGPVLTRSLVEDAVRRLFKGEEASRTFPDEMLKDSLVPQLWNRLGYQQFETSLKDNVHVLINLDDVGVVNEHYGHETGDRFIQVVGEVLHKLCQVQEGEGFRLYGDTFLFTFHEASEAHEFLRDAVQDLREMVPVGAYGQPSFAAGVGLDMAEAERSLQESKQVKRENHGDYRTNKGADVGHGRCYIQPLGGGVVVPEETPDIPEEYLTPKTTLPMQLRPEPSAVALGTDVLQQSEQPWPRASTSSPAPGRRGPTSGSGRGSLPPDFASQAQGDVP